MAGLLICTMTIFAQDIITRKNGEDIKAKVLEIDNNNVKYKLFDEPDGPIYTIRKSEILMIRHGSGRNEIFNTAPGSMWHYREPVTDLRAGMKYRELKNVYHYRDYISGFGDRYNPALMGFCSFLIPGLGQMISGEVGRGFGWLGGVFGANLVTIIGSGLTASSVVPLYDSYEYSVYFNEGKAMVGNILIFAGSMAALAIDICAIVDACRVAKVKNMYEQDLRRMNYSLELHPSVNYVHTPAGVCPAAGLTIAMKF